MTNKIKTAILISGKGSNMKALIQACQNQNIPAQIDLVIANKSQALGLIFARECGIKTAIIEHQKFSSRQLFDQEIDKVLRENNIELVCLAGFMRVLGADFVKKWSHRLINIHPSLLPDFKGANAIVDALNAKAKITGCTTHFVNEFVDSGEIILQQQVIIEDDDNFEKLSQKIHQLEHKIYPQTLKIVCEKLLKNNIK